MKVLINNPMAFLVWRVEGCEENERENSNDEGDCHQPSKEPIHGSGLTNAVLTGVHGSNDLCHSVYASVKRRRTLKRRLLDFWCHMLYIVDARATPNVMAMQRRPKAVRCIVLLARAFEPGGHTVAVPKVLDTH